MTKIPNPPKGKIRNYQLVWSEKLQRWYAIYY